MVAPFHVGANEQHDRVGFNRDRYLVNMPGIAKEASSLYPADLQVSAPGPLPISDEEPDDTAACRSELRLMRG